MKTYRLPMGWAAAFPEDWTSDYDEESGENRFSSPAGGLTLTLTAFHAEKNGIPASPDIMRSVFLHRLPAEGEEIPVPPELKIKGCETALRRIGEREICAGIFCEGELLLTQITGDDPQTVCEAIAYLTLIRRKK